MCSLVFWNSVVVCLFCSKSHQLLNERLLVYVQCGKFVLIIRGFVKDINESFFIDKVPIVVEPFFIFGRKLLFLEKTSKEIFLSILDLALKFMQTTLEHIEKFLAHGHSILYVLKIAL